MSVAEELREYHHDLMQDVLFEADAEGQFSESAFVEHVCSLLVDAGEFDTFDYTPHKSRGLRVDGYAGDPVEQDGVLTLVVSDFNQEGEPGSLSRSDMEVHFKRLEGFFQATERETFHAQLEESSPGYGLARLIFDRKGRINRVRFFLVTNRILSARIQEIAGKEINGIPTTYNVWDLARLHRLESSGKGKEDLDIDLRKDYGSSLPCLPAHLDHAGYEAYLAVVPGELLATIYDRWGARLLEQNVRCFLQARGNVNKGIRNTILNEPQMFFAYNNGITATAEAVESEVVGGVLHLVRLKNLQIVNGGQTTASIFASARGRDRADLSRLFVQMKLSIVAPQDALDIVPRISEYANSQNRVNAADFFANHPFHVRMEEFSRRIWAPAVEGAIKESKWFYERARGQYLDAQSLKTVAQKRKYKLEYPRHQMFTKTDLAKFENVWEGIPHIVSRGAQKNFAEFAKLVGKRWQEDSDQFNELYFKSAIARAIVFRQTESVVSSQSWYNGGYRAQVVAHTLSKLAEMVREAGKSLDFLAIWQRQGLSPALNDALVVIATAVHDVVTDPPAGVSNVTEWAKKTACWDRVRDLKIPFPNTLSAELVSREVVNEAGRDAKKVQKIDNAIEAQAKVLDLGGEFWASAMSWAKEHGIGTPKDHQIMAVAAACPNRIPSDKQCVYLMGVLDRLAREGCPLLTKR